MQVQDYFDFFAPNDIRLKGTRLGIETILWDYLDLGLFAEQIAARYPTLTFEQVYATLTYYWHNKKEIDAYLRQIEEEIDRQREEQTLNPLPAVKRLREIIEQREKRRKPITRT